MQRIQGDDGQCVNCVLQALFFQTAGQLVRTDATHTMRLCTLATHSNGGHPPLFPLSIDLPLEAIYGMAFTDVAHFFFYLGTWVGSPRAYAHRNRTKIPQVNKVIPSTVVRIVVARDWSPQNVVPVDDG